MFAITNPSVVCLSVTFVHPTQVVEPLSNIPSPLCTLAIWSPDICAKFYGDRPRELSVIFANENENVEKRENNKFVNEN